MTTHDLAPFVTTFFTRHLPAERNASPHTIAAYRDTLKLLLRFLAASMHRTAAALHVEDLTPDRILDFLEDLETTRRNTIRTRNVRLAAIHSFFRYVLDTDPALALLCQRVLAIPVKKAPRPMLSYLSETELAHVLAQIDRSTQVGERDYLLVALLYDTGGAHPGAAESGAVRCPIRPTSVCPALRQRPTRTAHAPAAANRSAGATLPRRGRTPRR